jgi:anti-sigma-K factor RskA
VSVTGFVERFWDNADLWRAAAAVLATTAVALLVAALVSREPPDFAERPVLAELRDTPHQQPAWAIRLARAAHQIAVDALDPPAPPAGKSYQLWLVAPGAGPPRPLGLLPRSGRKIIAETPANIRLLGGRGELEVTLESATGTFAEIPNGPPVFYANLPGAN